MYTLMIIICTPSSLNRNFFRGPIKYQRCCGRVDSVAGLTFLPKSVSGVRVGHWVRDKSFEKNHSSPALMTESSRDTPLSHYPPHDECHSSTPLVAKIKKNASELTHFSVMLLLFWYLQQWCLTHEGANKCQPSAWTDICSSGSHFPSCRNKPKYWSCDFTGRFWLANDTTALCENVISTVICRVKFIVKQLKDPILKNTSSHIIRCISVQHQSIE